MTHVDAVDTGGAPTASTLRRYSAFGVPREAAPAQSIERGFASRPIEGASGLIYMRARHYDPTTGRFLQPDPEGIASTQRYAFAEHNPYIYNDPTGRSSRGIGSLDRGVPSWAFEGRPNELAGWDVATAAFGDGGRGLSGLVQHDAAVRGRWADEAWDDGRYASWAANSTMAMFNEYVGGEVAYSLENPGQTIALAAVGGLAFKTAARATGAAVRGVTGGLPRGIQTLAEANIAGSGKAVLGHFPGYISKAQARGASYFDIGKAWDGLTDAQRWGANRHFLDQVASAGDQVLLSLPKTKIRPGSWLAKEAQYLTQEKGYRWVNQWSLVPK